MSIFSVKEFFNIGYLSFFILVSNLRLYQIPLWQNFFFFFLSKETTKISHQLNKYCFFSFSFSIISAEATHTHTHTIIDGILFPWLEIGKSECNERACVARPWIIHSPVNFNISEMFKTFYTFKRCHTFLCFGRIFTSQAHLNSVIEADGKQEEKTTLYDS